MIKDRRGRWRHIYNRWPHSTCAQRRPNMFRLTWPGPRGAEPTIRFEALREGMQEAEAVYLIGSALGGGRLPPELARRARQLLVDRIIYSTARYDVKWGLVLYHTNYYGWQDITRRTYELAGEISRALAAGGEKVRRN